LLFQTSASVGPRKGRSEGSLIVETADELPEKEKTKEKGKCGITLQNTIQR
jgi:hypothetical protein